MRQILSLAFLPQQNTNITQCVKSFLSRFRNKRQQKQQHPMPQILSLAFRDKKEQHPIRQFVNSLAVKWL
jgi:hypothetical protein